MENEPAKHIEESEEKDTFDIIEEKSVDAFWGFIVLIAISMILYGLGYIADKFNLGDYRECVNTPKGCYEDRNRWGQ